jgi:hypothetical protein
MKTLAALLLCLLPALTGCTYVRAPVGDEMVRTAPSQWQGRWLDHLGQENITIIVRDEAQGALELCTGESSSEGQPPTREHECVRGLLRRAGRHLVLNLEERHGNVNGAGHVWIPIVIRRHGDTVVGWNFDIDRLKTAAARNELAIERSGSGGVLVNELGAHMLERLLTGPYGTALDWQKPMIYSRPRAGGG